MDNMVIGKDECKASGEKKRARRDEWEIRKDVETVTSALAIFKDKERMADVKGYFEKQRAAQKSVDALMDGDLQTALGL